MDLPLRAFWMMNGCIGRVLAEKDLRALIVGNAAQSGESATKFSSNLTLEMGDVGRLKEQDPRDAERDQGAFDELKALSALM